MRKNILVIMAVFLLWGCGEAMEECWIGDDIITNIEPLCLDFEANADTAYVTIIGPTGWDIRNGINVVGSDTIPFCIIDSLGEFQCRKGQFFVYGDWFLIKKEREDSLMQVIVKENNLSVDRQLTLELRHYVRGPFDYVIKQKHQ